MTNTKEKTIADPHSKALKRRKFFRWLMRIALFIFSSILVTVLLVSEKSPTIVGSEFTVGEPAPRSLFSPFNFTYEKRIEAEQLRREAAAEVLPVLRFVPGVSEKVREQADNLLTALHEFRVSAAESLELKTPQIEWPAPMSEEIKNFLLQEADLEEVRKQLAVLTETYLHQDMMDDAQKALLMEKEAWQVVIIQNEHERSFLLKNVLTVEEVKRSAGGVVKSLIPKGKRERLAALDLFNAFIYPNLTWDKQETETRREKARTSIRPAAETIKKNELIVQRGRLITEEDRERLDEIQKIFAKKEVLHKFFAVGLLIFLLYVFMFFYMLFFERKILDSLRLTTLVHSILFLTLLISKAMIFWANGSTVLIPTALASLLIAFLLNFRFAVAIGAMMAVLITPMVDFDAGIMISTMMASVAAVFSSYRVRKRVQFLRVGFAIGSVQFLVIIIFQLLRELPLRDAAMLGLHGFVGGLLITMPIAFLLLPIFESLFDLVTDITLLEFSDLNHPLLKKMIVEAPGTYHHSLVVSTLAESAAESIQANALLARVGCYFHDIGKIARAEYFTENMASQAESRHNRLTPTMSCLIIMNHVKDGIDLGRRYKLRGPILRFIPEHQGTGVIYYFYKKAVDQAPTGEVVNPEDFRYPGPKPQSRETAIALLADSTEAASRSLKEPTAESIHLLVRKIINDKFVDGQLDECNLTLRDLHKIRESFVKNLMAIFHTRVIYPDKPNDRDHVDIFQQDQFAKFRIKS